MSGLLSAQGLYLFLLLFSNFAAAWLAAYAWRQHPVAGARASSLAFAGIFVWLSSISVQIIFPGSPAKPIWLIGYSCLLLSTLGWVALSAHLSHSVRWLARRNLILLGLVPLASILALWTNDWHGLMYDDLRPAGQLQLLEFSFGPGLDLAAAYSFFLVVLGIPLLARAASQGPSTLRRQALAVLAGALLPSIAGLVDTIGLRPLGSLDLAPPTVGLGALIIAWGLFRYRLFDVVPIARHRIFAAMPDGVVVLDDDGRVVDLNGAAEAILGCSLSNMLGRTAAEALKPFPELLHLCHSLKEGQIEFGIVKDDYSVFFEANLSALADGSGRSIGRILTLHDITDRLRIDRSLRESEQRYRDLADCLPETVFETDLTGRFTFGNRSGLVQFGLTEDDLRAGTNVMERIVPEDRERALANFALTLKGVPRDSNTYTAIRPDGSRFPITIYATSILRDGVPVGLRGFLVDNTARAKTEQQILQQERVVAVLGERERLARDLHDNLAQVLGFVNTQAQAVRGFLKAGHTASVDGQLARLITVVQEAHSEVREYILSVKNLSSPGWTLFPALRQALERYEKNYGLKTELVVPPDLTTSLSPSAEVQIERIVQEALTNTRKHSGARTVRVALSRQDGQVEVSVEDDGRGFDVERVSGPYAQTFGLRIMRERAHEIGATLEVCSAAGRGTRVRVLVPLSQEAHPCEQ